MTNVSKLDEFFEQELAVVKEVLITRDKQGKYSLFGKYTIIPTPTGHFKTFTPKHAEEHEFSTLVNATSCSTLHNAGRFKEARRIVSLDMRLISIKSDIENHIRLFQTTTNPFSKLTYTIKAEEDLLKQTRMLEEMSQHINSSKRLQERKFHSMKRPGFIYL